MRFRCSHISCAPVSLSQHKVKATDDMQVWDVLLLPIIHPLVTCCIVSFHLSHIQISQWFLPAMPYNLCCGLK